MKRPGESIDAMAMTTAVLGGAPVAFKPEVKQRKGAKQVRKDKRRQAKASRSKNRKR